MSPNDARTLHALGWLNFKRGRAVSLTEVLNTFGGGPGFSVGTSLTRLVGYGLAEATPHSMLGGVYVRYEAVVR